MRILRVLQSQSLRCGCFVGFYETYDGEVVVIVEEPGRGCTQVAHQPGRPIERAGPNPGERPHDAQAHAG